MDFIGPLLEDNGFNCIITMTDILGADIQIILPQTDITADDLVVVTGTVKMVCHWILFLTKTSFPVQILEGTTCTHRNEAEDVDCLPPANQWCVRTNEHNCKSGAVVPCSLYTQGLVTSVATCAFDLMNMINKSTGFS
jgi:hypothetical protein